MKYISTNSIHSPFRSKQRDTYKTLLLQKSSKQGGISGKAAWAEVAVISSTSAEQQQHFDEILADQAKQNELMRAQLQQKLDETNSSLDKLNRQFDKYKEEMMASNRTLSEDLNKFRATSTDVRLVFIINQESFKLKRKRQRKIRMDFSIDWLTQE